MDRLFDIREVNYLRFTQKFRYSSKKVMGIEFKKGLFYGVCNFFYSFLSSFFHSRLSFNCLIKQTCENVIFYSSQNQYNALIRLSEVLKTKGENVVMIKASQIPMWLSYCYSIRYSWYFWKYYLNTSSEDKKIIANELATFWRSYGDYILIKKWLKSTNINRFIVANDHIPLMRASILACNSLNITSIYIQHASVTEKFPPLISTYSFLDGEDALLKYRYNKSLTSDVYVIGGARFDLAVSSPQAEPLSTIGIALTLRDKKDCWEQLVNYIKIKFPCYSIVLRPHPRMEKESLKKYCDIEGIIYSNPLEETSFEFLRGIDFLVANETSTHLDAMIMHKPTVLFVGLSKIGLRDHYGMVNNGLLKCCSCFSELENFIMNPDLLLPNIERVRYYNASYRSCYEYKVSELIASILLGDSKEIGRLIEKEGIKYIDYEKQEILI